MRTIGVIGGGASGMAAAITIKRCKPNIKVIIFEKNESIGKKILATGNGKCNFTNKKIESKYYNSSDKTLLQEVLCRFSYEDCITFFHSLGIKELLRDDYCYPRSGQARTVLMALIRELNHQDVIIKEDCRIDSVKKIKNGFLLTSDNNRQYEVQKVILATGGKAGIGKEPDNMGYQIADKFGHEIIPTVPALVQLVVDRNPLKAAKGVRTNAKVTAYCRDKKLAVSSGELQITDYGISGILVFQISRFISYALYQDESAIVSIDFASEYTKEEFYHFLLERYRKFPHFTWLEFLNGFFPEKLAMVLLKLSGLPCNDGIKGCESALQVLICHTKDLKLSVVGTKGFDMAQVTAGGVSTKQINPDTMESCICPGLYFTGELMDVDGMCGGYNLHFAWASGTIAGLNCVL